MNSSDSRSLQAQSPLTDQQMDLLLRDFFASEVPRALPESGFSAPSVRRVLTTIAPAVSSPAASLRSVRLAAALAIAALALCALLLNQDAERVATMAAKAKTAGPEDTMLVSPQGDTGSRQVPVGADGLLLQETDQIQLAPPR